MILLKELMLILEERQGRVSQGSVGQNIVIDYLQRQIGNQLDIISVAPEHSKAPDIVASTNGEQFQIEVKSRKTMNTPMVLFNSTTRRGDSSPREDAFVSTFEKEPAHLESAMDYYRHNVDPTVGYPGDPGTPPSGKFPYEWRSSDAAVLNRIRQLIIKSLQSEGNNYLAIRVNNNVSIFWTGLGNNVLGTKQLPKFNYAMIDTYGTGYKGAIRFAVRCALQV